VSAIIIWHLFFVVFRRGVYPMSWTWVTGRMPLAEWQHHHGRAATDPRAAELVPRIDEPPVPPAGEGVQPAH
jgi:hypothetical protein